MNRIDHILGDFIDSWNAGRRPDVDAYLDQVPEAERDDLAQRILTWLEIAPTPAYDDATRSAIREEPLLKAAFAEAEFQREPWSTRLPTLRERAGLAVRDVAARLVAMFDLAGEEERTTRYLEQVESGELDSRRLSRRLLVGLAEILGADRTSPDAPPAWSPQTWATPMGQAFFRADEADTDAVAGQFDALSHAALSPAPEPMDEVDRLFLGGPDG